MRRCTVRLRLWRTSRSGPGLTANRVQLLSTPSATPSATNNGQSAEGQETGLHQARKNQDPGKTQDIIVDDLSATLEAHRARNRAAVIRKIEPQSGNTHELFRRPLLQDTGSEDGKKIHTTGEEASAASNHALSQLEYPLAEDGKAEEDDGIDGEGFPTSSAKSGKSAPVWRWPADSLQAKTKEARAQRKGFTRSIDPLEYTGMAMFVKEPWTLAKSTPSEFVRPWLPYMEVPIGDNFGRLSKEIRAFEAFMRLSPGEEAAAQLVINDFTSIVKNIVPTNPLTLLGSRSSGLASPTSDFDFSISMPSSESQTTEILTTSNPRQLITTSIRALRKIEKGLRKSEQIVDTEMVAARVPLVSCKHRATGLNIQLQTMSPYQAAQQYTAAYLAELPSLRPLYILIRHFLEIRDLTIVFEGGLGSYTILMMIVTALKHASGRFAADDLGGQLLHVLDFYGNKDLYRHGFSANPPRVFDKSKNKKWPMEERIARAKDPQLRGIDEIVQKSDVRKPYLLCLQDPASHFNDLGKNAYAIKHVQATFQRAREGILKSFHNRKSLGVTEEWSALNAMVRGNYKDFELDRRRIERCVDRDTILGPLDTSTDSVQSFFDNRLRTYKGNQEADEFGANPKTFNSILPDLKSRRRNTISFLNPLIRKNNTSTQDTAFQKHLIASSTNINRQPHEDSARGKQITDNVAASTLSALQSDYSAANMKRMAASMQAKIRRDEANSTNKFRKVLDTSQPFNGEVDENAWWRKRLSKDDPVRRVDEGITSDITRKTELGR